MRLDRQNRGPGGLQHIFRRIADDQTGQSGTSDRAHDDQVCIDLIRQVSDDLGGLIFDQIDLRAVAAQSVVLSPGRASAVDGCALYPPAAAPVR